MYHRCSTKHKEMLKESPGVDSSPGTLPGVQGVGGPHRSSGGVMLQKVFLISTSVLLVAVGPALAQFPAIDLTAGQTNVTSAVDGSIWSSNITQPTGTGVYKPFLREHDSPNEEGFNTHFPDPQAPLDDKSDPNFTHSVQWNTPATVTINSVDYSSFQLDANEPQNKTE